MKIVFLKILGICVAATILLVISYLLAPLVFIVNVTCLSVFLKPISISGLKFQSFLGLFVSEGFYVFLLILAFVSYLLKKKKFVIPVILSFLIPLISPLTFTWLEIHLYKQKEWLWFWYVMTSYIVVCGSGYYFFVQISQQ